MLRPAVRKFRHCNSVRCRCHLSSRQIHISSIRAIDDPQKSRQNDSADINTTPDDNAQSIPSAEIPIGQNISDRRADPTPLETPFEIRRRERESRLDQDRQRYNLPTESREERDRKFRQTVHDTRKQQQEEANKRGEEIFEMINRARAERGEPPINGFPDPSERQPRRDRNDRPPREYRSRAPSSRRGRGRQERDEREKIVGERLDRRVAQVREQQREQVFSPSFNPSDSMYQGHDEVDYELAYELPDPVPIKDNFTIANRDGSVREDRKTNRDFDELPEDAGSFIDMAELGPIGRTFYAPELPPIEEEEEIEKRIGATTFPEDKETDVDELWRIKTEIEEGLSAVERQEKRHEREVDKAMELQQEQHSEGFNHGTWGQLVPLPKPHRPETKDIDNYEAPVFTHEAFQYGIPAIPFGSRGRLEATKSAAYDLTDPILPPELHVTESLPENDQESQDLDTTIADLTELVNEMEADFPETDEPLEEFKRGKKPPPLKITRGRTTNYDPQHEFEIEDLYSDDQLKIWREMHKDSFAPENVKFPAYESEEEGITLQQQEREALQRSEVFRLVDQLDAATLKNFRRRDEFEIRDIRRRLGLPIVNDTVMEEAYFDKTKLDGIPI